MLLLPRSRFLISDSGYTFVPCNTAKEVSWHGPTYLLSSSNCTGTLKKRLLRATPSQPFKTSATPMSAGAISSRFPVPLQRPLRLLNRLGFLQPDGRTLLLSVEALRDLMPLLFFKMPAIRRQFMRRQAASAAECTPTQPLGRTDRSLNIVASLSTLTTKQFSVSRGVSASMYPI